MSVRMHNALQNYSHQQIPNRMKESEYVTFYRLCDKFVSEDTVSIDNTGNEVDSTQSPLTTFSKPEIRWYLY